MTTTEFRTFPSELGISTRVGLTRGVGLPGEHLSDFATEQFRYREDLRVRQAQIRAARRAHHKDVLTRWTAWLSSDQRRRSSAAQQSCSASPS